MPYHLLIAWGHKRKDGFMPFPRALAWSEMQTALFRIWICVADSMITMLIVSLIHTKYVQNVHQKNQKYIFDLYNKQTVKWNELIKKTWNIKLIPLGKV